MMRIMCMGDSNSMGVGNPPIEIAWANNQIVPDCLKQIIGYRYKLKQLLTAAGIPAEFVGSQRAGWATFSDCEHEGWPGEGIPKIKSRIDSGALEAYEPDVVLLLVGANDMWVSLDNRIPITNAKAGEWVNVLKLMIQNMCLRRPGMSVIVGKPCTPTNTPAPLAVYRYGIDSIVTELNYSGKKVYAIDTTGCVNDGTHFTIDGHNWLAYIWCDAIKVLSGTTVVTQPPVSTQIMATVPILQNAVVSQVSGDTNTEFTFSVTYSAPTNTPPQYAYLVLAKPDGQRIWLPATSMDTTYTDGAVFTYKGKLSAGTYLWQFEFKSNNVIHWGNPANASVSVTSAVTQTGWGISANSRYIVDSAGNPFFWVGDTAWTAVTSLSVAEMATYLDKRKSQGFNTIQFVGAHWESSGPLTADGQLPFLNGNPATPNPAYWDKVGTFIDMCNARGLLACLMPAWGEFVIGSTHQINANNALQFGQWLGIRYISKTNLVYALGGDVNPTGYENVYNLMAQGIIAGDGGIHLITFHPGGGGTPASVYFPSAGWLDFSMVQTQHGLDIPDYSYVLNDYYRTPIRPTLLAESRYESIIPWPQTAGVRVDDHQVRKSAYSAVLSGSCGFTYGANGVFQFFRGGDEYWKPRVTWQQALDWPGAVSMTHLKFVMTSVQWWKLVPNTTMITESFGVNGQRVCSAVALDKTFGLIYFPEYVEIVVTMNVFGGTVNARWFNPRTGEYISGGSFQNSGSVRFLPPSGPDYVLVLKM